MAEYLVQGETLGAIADAIREKTGDTEKMKPAEFPEKISGIETGADVSGVTATAKDVLIDRTIVDASGNVVDGTMAYIGEFHRYLYYGCEEIAIPEGFHDGSGKITALGKARKITPTKKEQWYLGADSPEIIVVERDGELIRLSAYPFISEVTVEPIPDEYQNVSNVTATAEDVKLGKVFVDAEGNEVEGTLEVKETVNMVWAGTSNGVTNSLAGNGIIRYVTFMNHDGTEEYGRKSVVAGENCVDPVTGGYLDTPTRESTAQYNYTYAGWATEPNGGLNADALKAVTEDRTVYANFVSAVRYYTITFYDSDGTTVLATKSVAYGSVPSYTPTKDGDYTFAGWTPEPSAVTGDASYIATWEEKPSFEYSSWAKIKEICDAGTASEYFAVGDKRPITLTYGDGTSETITFTIVDMGVDTKQDGTVAALTIMADNQVKNSLQPATSKQNYCAVSSFDNSVTFFANLLSAFPADLQEVIATVVKYKNSFLESMYPTEYAKIFVPTGKNLVNKDTNHSDYMHNTYLTPYIQYAYFANGATIKRTKLTSTEADDYWTGTIYNKLTASMSGNYVDGTSITTSMLTSTSHGIVPCFCI